MLDYFRNCSRNAHPLCCEDSPTKGLYIYNLFLVRWPCPSFNWSQLLLKLDTCLACTIAIIVISRTTVKLWHDGRLMHGTYADARFNYLDLDTRSQWIGRGKQYLSYDTETAHDGRCNSMHDIYARVRFDDPDLVLDFENVCKARPSCFLCFCSALSKPGMEWWGARLI